MPCHRAFPDVSASIKVQEENVPEQMDWGSINTSVPDGVPTTRSLIHVPEGAAFGVFMSIAPTWAQWNDIERNEALVAQIWIDGLLVKSKLFSPELFTRPPFAFGFNVEYGSVAVATGGGLRYEKQFHFKTFAEGGEGEGSIQVVVWHVRKVGGGLYGQQRDVFQQENHLRGVGLDVGQFFPLNVFRTWVVQRLHGGMPVVRFNFRYRCMQQARPGVFMAAPAFRLPITHPMNAAFLMAQRRQQLQGHYQTPQAFEQQPMPQPQPYPQPQPQPQQQYPMPQQHLQFQAPQYQFQHFQPIQQSAQQPQQLREGGPTATGRVRLAHPNPVMGMSNGQIPDQSVNADMAAAAGPAPAAATALDVEQQINAGHSDAGGQAGEQGPANATVEAEAQDDETKSGVKRDFDQAFEEEDNVAETIFKAFRQGGAQE